MLRKRRGPPLWFLAGRRALTHSSRKRLGTSVHFPRQSGFSNHITCNPVHSFTEQYMPSSWSLRASTNGLTRSLLLNICNPEAVIPWNIKGHLHDHGRNVTFLLDPAISHPPSLAVLGVVSVPRCGPRTRHQHCSSCVGSVDVGGLSDEGKRPSGKELVRSPRESAPPC
jgi:hypothetical protein